jgi:hypothetical protein
MDAIFATKAKKSETTRAVEWAPKKESNDEEAAAQHLEKVPAAS